MKNFALIIALTERLSFGDIIARQCIAPNAHFQLMLHLNLPLFPNISKYTNDLSGLAAPQGLTITAKWSDRTRPLNTTGGFQMCEELVRNTSNTPWPLVTFRTILKGKVICFHENFRGLVVLFQKYLTDTKL